MKSFFSLLRLSILLIVLLILTSSVLALSLDYQERGVNIDSPDKTTAVRMAGETPYQLEELAVFQFSDHTNYTHQMNDIERYC